LVCLSLLAVACALQLALLSVQMLLLSDAYFAGQQPFPEYWQLQLV
jgi:hypothetical protein